MVQLRFKFEQNKETKQIIVKVFRGRGKKVLTTYSFPLSDEWDDEKIKDFIEKDKGMFL